LKTIPNILYSTHQKCNAIIAISLIAHYVFSIIYHTAGMASAISGVAPATAQASSAISGIASATAQALPAISGGMSATAKATWAISGVVPAIAQTAWAISGSASAIYGTIPAFSGTLKYAYFTLQNKAQYFLQNTKMLQSIEIRTIKYFSYRPRAPCPKNKTLNKHFKNNY
jgi:hypothetical protein